jgi:two-component system, NarL family, response regulator YdfI
VIRVSIAASSAIVRAGLETVIRSNDAFELINVLRSDEVEDWMQNVVADVLVLELPHLDDDWNSTFLDSSIPIVLLTDASDSMLLTAGMRGTVRAVLSEDASPAEIVAAVCSASVGLITLQQPTLELLMNDPRPTPIALDEPLSPRELEVLGMLAEGLSNKLAAYRLGISEHTVKFHVTSIMAKLHASSRTDAVMQGIRRGLVMI